MSHARPRLSRRSVAWSRPSGPRTHRRCAGPAAGAASPSAERDDDERAREPLDVADRAEEVARRELRRRVDLARRVRRREHQVGLARDVVQLLHRVRGEVRGDRRPRSRASSSSVAVFWLNVGPVAARRQRRRRRRASSSSSRLGTRALPPRSPNDTKPSRVGQISRVRPMFAPRREPRNPVCGKRAGVAMFATSTTSCIETSTRCGAPVAQRGQRGERGLRPGVRVRRRLGAAHRRAVGVAGAVHVPGRGHHAEVGGAPRRARPVEAERRDAAPTPRPARGPGRAGACPGAPGVSNTTSAAASSASSAGSSAASARDLLAGVPRGARRCRASASPAGGTTRTTVGAEVAEHAPGRAPAARRRDRRRAGRRAAVAAIRTVLPD